MTKQNNHVLFLLWGLLFFAVMYSLSLGPIKITLSQILNDIKTFNFSKESIIFFEIRLPRTFLAVIVGASLGLSGAALQGFFRNPLAGPGLLGVSGCSALGAVLILYTGIYAINPVFLPVGGMIGALISVLIIYLLSGRIASSQTLILAGIAINMTALSAVSLVLNFSSNPYAALEIVYWQMGSIANKSWEHVVIAFPFMLIGWGLLFSDKKALDALSLGEDTASTLGVSLGFTRLKLIIGTALSVGAGVSICGIIGFVGLIVPHMMRPFVNNEPGKLLGASALGGAVFLLISDILLRIIPSSFELKLGVLTALIGAPFFILLVIKMRKGLL